MARPLTLSSPHVLGHISIGVRSCAISEAYYTPLFSALNMPLVFSSPPPEVILGYGPSADMELINIFEVGEDALAPGPGFHIAFNAPSRQAVRDFWKAGTKNGGKDEGAPGLRQHYGSNYYAAFVRCPDGWKLEAVFQGEEGGAAALETPVKES